MSGRASPTSSRVMRSVYTHTIPSQPAPCSHYPSSLCNYSEARLAHCLLDAVHCCVCQVFSRVDHKYMGTLADYCITSEHSIAFKPRTLTHDQAAALPLVSLTALQGLRDVGGLTAGQKLLITGASGGVGTSAIQIARILGASEITVTCSSQDASRVTELGATRTIDYKAQKFNELVKDQDLVFDTTGEANSAFTCLKSGGTCVSIIAALTPDAVKAAGMDVPATAQVYLAATAAAVQANAALHNTHYKAMWVKADGSELAEIGQWVDAGRMKPVVDKVYPLEQAGAAFDYLADGHVQGKIVIHVADK